MRLALLEIFSSFGHRALDSHSLNVSHPGSATDRMKMEANGYSGFWGLVSSNLRAIRRLEII